MSEPEAKQRRKGDICCSACKKKPVGTPGGVAWAVMNGKVALGDKCASCAQLHSKAFPYISWVEFTKMHVSEEPYSHVMP